MTWSVLMDLHYTGREREPALVDYVCVYRGCLDLPTVGLLLSPLYQSQIPWVRLLMDFLGTLSWMNGCIWMVHNRIHTVYTSDKSCVCKFQTSTFRVQIENSLRLVGHLQWLLVPIRVVLIKLIQQHRQGTYIYRVQTLLNTTLLMASPFKTYCTQTDNSST